MESVRTLLVGYCVGDRLVTGLSAIPFDKLANLAARTWSTARTISPDKGFSPIPFVEINGVHGPGHALVRHRDQGPCFVITAFHRLQLLLPERTLFDIRLPASVQGVGPTDYRTTVVPAIPHMDSETVLSALGAVAGEFVVQLASSLPPLDVDQLRALGKHKSAASLNSALEFHWRRLRDFRARAFDHIRAGRPEARRLQREMQTSCSELKRKAIDNEYRYEHARTIVGDALPKPSLAFASFDYIHAPAAQIWCDEGLRDGRARVHPVSGLVDLVGVVVDWSSKSNATDQLHDRLQEQLERALSEIPDHQLPGQVNDLVSSDGRPVIHVLDRLEQLFAKYGL